MLVPAESSRREVRGRRAEVVNRRLIRKLIHDCWPGRPPVVRTAGQSCLLKSPPPPAAPVGSSGGQPAPGSDLESIPVNVQRSGNQVAELGGSTAGDGSELEQAVASTTDVVRSKPGRASRLESIDSVTDTPTAGGGTQKRRVPTQPQFAASTNARAVAARETGISSSEGETVETDMSPAAEATSVSRVASTTDGGPERNSADISGEQATDVRVATGRIARANNRDDGPIAVASVNDNLPGRRARKNQFSASTTVRVPNVAVTSDAGTGPNTTEVADGELNGPLERQGGEPLVLEHIAEVGPAGAGEELASTAGVTAPRAQSHNEQLDVQIARFIRRDIGGPLSIPATARAPKDAFRRRMERHGSPDGGGVGGVPPKTEAAIELGLVFLSKYQGEDGRWSLVYDPRATGEATRQRKKPSLHSDTGATGLALLSFLGAGYHHLDDKYKDNVQAALDHLVKNQSPDGNPLCQRRFVFVAECRTL